MRAKTRDLTGDDDIASLCALIEFARSTTQGLAGASEASLLDLQSALATSLLAAQRIAAERRAARRLAASQH